MDDLEQALNNLNLSSARSPDEIVRAAHLLADASKTDLFVRKGLGQPLPLQQLVALIDSSLNDSLETAEVALRCVGNACIENDTARQNVTDLGFGWALRCLMTRTQHDTETAVMTAKVLYNVCMDFEPAQQQCYREHVHHQLIHLLHHEPVKHSPDASLLAELLFWISSQRDAAADTSATSSKPDTLSNMLGLPASYSDALVEQDYSLLLGVCTILLRSPEFQNDLPSHAEDLWRMFWLNEDKINTLKTTSELDADDEKNLIALSTDMIWVLSDIAALPEAQSIYGLRHEWIQSVLDVIEQSLSVGMNRAFTGGCQVIGNLLWIRKDAKEFAHFGEREGLRTSLLHAMSTAEDTEVLHSAAGLCLQLCRSQQIREQIASDDSVSLAVEHLCRHQTPQIRQDGMKLLRALGQGNARIQQRFAELAREAMADATSANAGPGADIDASMIDAPG